MTKSAMRKHIDQLPQRYVGISSIFLFGSFLKSNNFGDVDIIVVFSKLEHTVASRQISRNFFDEFGIRLHIQIFFDAQRKELDRFLTTAERWDQIYG